MKNAFLLLIILLSYDLSYSQNVFVESIQISGNKITKEDIIMREVVINSNKFYDYDKLKKDINSTKNNLVNLKLFNFVEIEEIKKSDTIIIIINLTERWYLWPYPILEISERNFNSWWREFSSNNYTDFSRLNYGVFLNWENFRGRNELIKLKIRKGFKEHYLFSYSIPYLNRKKIFGLISNYQIFRRKKSFYKTQDHTLIYYTNEDKYTTEDHQINIQSIYRKGIHHTHKIEFNYFFSYVDNEITNRNPNYILSNTNIGSYSKVSYIFENEKRDYVEYPLNGYFLNIEVSKHFKGNSPLTHFEAIGHIEKHLKIKNRFFLGSSLKTKICSKGEQPYFAQEGFGFDDYVRGYEYYVIDGKNFWLSKTAIKYNLVEKKDFNISYVKMKQFNKSFYSLYLGLFSDIGYVNNQDHTDNNYVGNHLSNSLLFSNGISLDYVTYYDKLLRIEFSINHLGEKGVFLHFSNPFGSKKKL